MRNKRGKNFFFPFTWENEEELPDGYNYDDDILVNLKDGWYDTLSGSHFMFFEKTTDKVKETY